MMNRVEMNEDMMVQVNGGRGNIYRNPTITYPKEEPREAVGVDASENDSSFWGWLSKLL